MMFELTLLSISVLNQFLCICPVYSDFRKDLYLKYSHLLKDSNGLAEGDLSISIENIKNPDQTTCKIFKI